MRKSLFICIAFVSFIASAQAQTATEILAKVSSVYAGCRTYSDEGTANRETRGTPIGRSYFRTSFVRPDAIRFQMWLNSDKPAGSNPWVVWKKGDDLIRGQGQPFNLFWALPYERLSLDDALWRMAPYSAGSSMTVPQLLLPNSFRSIQFFSLIVDAKVTGEENINGRPSLRIEGTLSGFPITLWIDKSQYVVLKSYRKITYASREEDITVQYNPKLNAAVPPDDLTLPRSPNKTVVDTTKSTPLLRLPQVSQSVARPPRLRNFGSSLSRAEKTGGVIERTADDEDVVRVETDLVVSTVLVLDAQMKIVRGLSQKDFIVKEDDKLQEVTTFSLGDNKDLPRSIVLIIDYSPSQLPYIRTSIESAKILVDKLNPKDRMAVVTDDVKLLVDFTSDKQLLKTQLESLKTNALSGVVGASQQYDALMASLSELFDNEDVRPIIIFQTDGDQLELLKGGKGSGPYWWPKYGLQDILTVSEKTRASVYSVISGTKFIDVPPEDLARRVAMDRENRRNANHEVLLAMNLPTSPTTASSGPPQLSDQALAKYVEQWQHRQLALMVLAKFTGTVPEFLEEPGQADEIYTRVLNDIERRYVIGYYPTNRSRDGQRRKVSIEVRDHPEYVVWGQKAYFARKEP